MENMLIRAVEIHTKYPLLFKNLTISDCRGDIMGFAIKNSSTWNECCLSYYNKDGGYTELLSYPEFIKEFIEVNKFRDSRKLYEDNKYGTMGKNPVDKKVLDMIF